MLERHLRNETACGWEKGIPNMGHSWAKAGGLVYWVFGIYRGWFSEPGHSGECGAGPGVLTPPPTPHLDTNSQGCSLIPSAPWTPVPQL